jgi:hypothetical protein
MTADQLRVAESKEQDVSDKQAVPLYAIKPLGWKYSTDNGGQWERWDCETIFCRLRVDRDRWPGSGGVPSVWSKWSFSWCVVEVYDEGKSFFDSLEEAKAAAEKWYMDRLMPALEPKGGVS